MRIAVLADTHDRIPPQLPAMLAEADEIWHLGDVCAAAVLDDLHIFNKSLKVVRGNCDPGLEWPLTLDLQRVDFQIRLVHVPPTAAPPGTDLLLHGHTHVPRHERVGDAYFLNPGCITRPNRGAPRSFAWLTLKSEKAFDWQLQLLE